VGGSKTSASALRDICSVRGWPYRDACPGQPESSVNRNVRMISLDVVASPAAASSRPVYVAQR
jgi:hypothetical protein